MLKHLVRYFKNGGNVRVALTYPQRPDPGAVIYKIFNQLGYRITDDINERSDVAVFWEHCTYRHPDSKLQNLSQVREVWNLQCNDISKKRVEEVHKAVFGYGLAVDPLRFHGPCVKKSNENATHDGEIIQCPVDVVDQGAVYQRIVNNTRDTEYVEDIRVPVFGNIIPFCYVKTRSLRFRFSNENTSARLVERDAVLSSEEVELILRFCRKMGLDYGELDALRDMENGQLYIVDVNNTPWGPPNHLDEEDVPRALERLSETFAEAARSFFLKLN